MCFSILRCELNARVSAARRGPEGFHVVAPPEPGTPGSAARQGAVELIIKTFSKKDLMFKGATPEKR